MNLIPPRENTKKSVVIEQKELMKASVEIVDMLYRRLEEKGYGTFSSRHEIMGVITEEYKELEDALISNKTEAFKDELIDIAVGCLFGIACINSKTLDW